MKKKMHALIALALSFLLGLSTVTAFAASTSRSLELADTAVKVDGRTAALEGYNLDNGNNFFKLRDMAAAVDVRIDWDATTNTAFIDTAGHYKEDPTQLITGNWAPDTRERLQTLIDKNANQGRYVCFDFDNTSSIYDIGNALLAYQILNLRFAMEPDTFRKVLATELPDLNREIGRNLDGKPVNCKQLIEDLSKDYTWLYREYEGFQGKRDLNYIYATRQYQDFAAKLRWMYEGIGNTFDVSVAYPWSIYLLSGMTPDEVYTLATESNTYWSEYGRYAQDTWTSPVDMTTSSGAVSVKLDTGIAFTDELVDLYQTLNASGFDLYIISASPYDLIRAASDQFGYGVPADHIYAMQCKLDGKGRYTNEYNYDWGGEGLYAQTQGPGKSQIITNFIAPKYGGQGPILVCGDSAGDMNMMTDWMECGDTQLGLIFNRYRSPSGDPLTWQASTEAKEDMGQIDSRFVLQGRDENAGQLRPSEYTVLQGTKDEVLVRPAA